MVGTCLQTLLLLGLMNAAAEGRQPFERTLHPDYVPHVENDERRVLDGTVYAVIAHAVERWDPDEVSRDGLSRLLRHAAVAGIPRLGLVTRFGGNTRQFFEPHEVDLIVNSDAGQHNLAFPNASTFLFAGGNLSLCLCETVRDVLKGAAPPRRRPVRLVLVGDAIFEYTVAWPHRLSWSTGKKATLDQLLRDPLSGDESLIRYLMLRILGDSGQAFCPMQNHYGSPNIEKRSYQFRVYRGARPVAWIGPAGGETVELVIIDSSQLGEMFRASAAGH